MCNHDPKKTQRGYVTVFIAVLFGVAFTATVLGSAAYIRSTAAVTMASHAQTQAQLKAWTGVEIVREYLASLQSSSNLTAMAASVAAAPNGLPLTINNVQGITATLVSVDSATSPTIFTAQITGSTATGTRAASTSTIQAVYSVNAGTAGAGTVPALNFNRNLVLSGGITITPANASTNYSINVMGDVTATAGNAIQGVSAINSTGTINIGSRSTFNNLNSNCDVVLTGQVTSVNINAQRNICETEGAAASGEALANGSASSDALDTANGTIAAIVHPTPAASCSAQGASQNGTTTATCPVPSVTGVNLNFGSGGAAEVTTEGNVVLASGHINTLYATGNLTVTNYGTIGNGEIGGTLSPTTLAGVHKVTGYSVNITPAPLVVLQTAQFSATTLQSLANYTFTVDANGFVKVQVFDVAGINNGNYYLGKYDGTDLDYLCTTVSGSESLTTWTEPTCTAPAKTAAAQICKGFSTSNSCFSVATSAGVTTYTINGDSMVPGIVYFTGSLNLETGTYYDTFIATYNINTSQADTVYAPNFAGTNGTYLGVNYAPTGICTNSWFPNYYPLEFCASPTAAFATTAAAGVGNYVFMAGSTGSPTYNGGNVFISGASNLYGDIKAGNEFQSGAGTTIAGIVTALAQGAKTENSMGGSTTFNYSKIPATEDITGGATSNETDTASGGTISIEWTKYL